MRIKQLLHILLIGLFIGIGANKSFAQVKFYTSVSEGPFIAGQAFQVQYIAEGATDIQKFNLPEFKGFAVHEVFDSKSTSVQSPGYQVIETVSKIVVLSSKKTGSFIIPGASALIDGKKFTSANVKIKIVAASAASSLITYPEDIPVDELSVLKPGEDINAKIKQNHFLKAYTTKQSCFAGEELMLTYKMYSRLNANSQVQKRPSLTGFSIVEMADSYDAKADVEKIDGNFFYTNLVRKVHAFPLQPGTIKLDAAEVSSTVHFVKADADRLGSSFYDHAVTIYSNPLEIVVKPLPGNQPEDFSGAVGKFLMSIEVLQKEIHPGDLVKIRLTLQGKGNIPLLVPPVIKWPKGVDTAEPAVKEDYNKYVFPLIGSKTFEYSFAAPDTGDYFIPATSFVYFNPETKSYERSKTDSINLRVTPDLNKKEILQPDATAANANEPKQLYWFGLVAVLIVGWIVYQVTQWNKPDKETQKTTVKTSVPAPVVEKKDPLESAKRELSNGNTLSFYRQTEQAIWQVIAEYSHVLPSSLNKQNVSTVLSSKGVDHSTITDLMNILKECEWALYAPDHETEDAEAMLVRLEPVLAKLL